MEYVGEHILPGEIGRLSVSLAFAAALVAIIGYYLFEKTQNSNYRKLARSAFAAHSVGVFGIVLSLFYLLLNHYFEYDYVFKHSSLDLETRFVFSAFWEGQEGSFILWLFWHAVLGLILMFTAKKWESYAMMVFSAVQAFLASMVLGIYPLGLKIGSSPFILMRETEENLGLPWTQFADYLDRFPYFMDGSGLNPLLQNYWMTIHPPTLFLGFASTLVPFALAMAALFKGDLKSWVKPTIPWAFFSVGILGLGILMGGAWAYEALSFGGFWAWDPVENSSLVPWITMAGAAHLLIVFRNKRTGLAAAFFMSILTFILILYSTFLTRSGVLGDSSVHAFVDLGLSGQLLIYLLFFTLISLGLFLYRYKQMKTPDDGDDLSSREFWMFIASLVLLISAFQIIFSTSIPVINKLIGPEGLIPILEDAMAPPLDAIKHYNSWQLPFAIIIALLMAIGQFLKYGKTSLKFFWRGIAVGFASSLVVTALFAQLYDFWRDPLYLSLLFAAVFASVSNLWFWLKKGKGKLSFAGSSVAHMGFALILLGALISNARKDIISQSQVSLGEDFPSNENALMELGDTVPMGQYQAVFEGMEVEKDKQFYQVSYFKDQNDDSPEFTLRPFLQMSEQMGPNPNPDTKHFWDRDIYTHITYSSDLEAPSPEGYKNEAEIKFNTGDTALYRNHFVILDSLEYRSPGGLTETAQLMLNRGESASYKDYQISLDSVSVNARMDEETKALRAAKITANLQVLAPNGKVQIVRPAFIIDDQTKEYRDTLLEEYNLALRFEDVETSSKKIILKVSTQLEEFKNSQQTVLAANIRVVNVMGNEFSIQPAIINEEDFTEYRDTSLEAAGLKFRFEDVDAETGDIVLKAWTKKDEDEKPFIVQKAIIFPMINILWIGSILMVIGSFIAVWQRLKA
jgi:cytochrome c-type biogenesis protein CcmF